MTTAPPATVIEATVAGGRSVVLGGRRFPVSLPKRSDPRLKLSATILTLTVLGLTILNFQVSIPQIAVCVVLCGMVDFLLLFRRERIIAWPASAIQTGLSIAFIFRVSGARHGDYWSTRGLGEFVFVVVICILSKNLLRHKRRHIFNPSNIGLVWGLLLLGPSHVFSEHLWWAPLGPPILLAMAVIFAGALWVLRQVRMLQLAGSFLATFFVLVGLLALFGRSYYATWHHGPVGGSFYWVTVALSPELLIFVFFMITDPQTAPKSPTGRIIFGVITAIVCAGLVSVQSTEFGIKVAILASLLVSCALVPAIESVGQRLAGRQMWPPSDRATTRQAASSPGQRLVKVLRNPVLVAVVVIAVAAPVDAVMLSRDTRVVLIERGLTARSVQ